MTHNLEPLITPLKNWVNVEVKHERDGGSEEQREFKHSVGHHDSEQVQDELDGDIVDDTADTVVEESGDLVGLTSTPKSLRKPSFTREISSLRDITNRKNNTLGARYMRELITNADNDLAYGPRLDPRAEGYTLGK